MLTLMIEAVVKVLLSENLKSGHFKCHETIVTRHLDI